jgi:hypothetical protein
MTIIHEPIDLAAGKAFMFARLGGISCSICAPKEMTQSEVEAIALVFAEPDGDRWIAVDKSKPPLRIGEPTPNPCTQDPAGRLHWFLLSEAATMGLAFTMSSEEMA